MCKLCVAGKACQQNLGHHSEELLPTDFIHVHLDISSIKNFGGLQTLPSAD